MISSSAMGVLPLKRYAQLFAENALLKCDLVNDENDCLFVFHAPLFDAHGNAPICVAADAPVDTAESGGRRGRGAGAGAAARRAARSGGGPGKSLTFITRKIREYEVLDEEGLALIEANADTVLEEVGIEFRDDAEALQLWREAGADVKGERVHFPKGLPRSLLKTAPSVYTQYA
eukprot:gene22942-27507_t